jgi:hypothetical protein
MLSRTQSILIVKDQAEMTILMERVEKTEEETEETSKGSLNEDLVRKILFSEPQKPKPAPVVSRQPSRELREFKKTLKSLISEAWDEMS